MQEQNLKDIIKKEAKECYDDTEEGAEIFAFGIMEKLPQPKDLLKEVSRLWNIQEEQWKAINRNSESMERLKQIL